MSKRTNESVFDQSTDTPQDVKPVKASIWQRLGRLLSLFRQHEIA